MADNARRELNLDRKSGHHPSSRKDDDAWWDPHTGRPTPLAIAAWVENPATCPDAGSIERHVRECPACSEEAALARAFFDETAAPPIEPADLAWIRSHEHRPLVAPMADGGGDLTGGGLTSLEPKIPAPAPAPAAMTEARPAAAGTRRVTRRRRVIEIGLATSSGLAAALVLMLSGSGDLEVSPIGAATSPTYRGAAESSVDAPPGVSDRTDSGRTDSISADSDRTGTISATTSRDDRTSESYVHPDGTQRPAEGSSTGLETPAGSSAASPKPDGGDSRRR